LKGIFVILARKINGKKGNLMLENGNFIEDLWKHGLDGSGTRRGGN
jgi:hypothetical protein